MILAHLGAEYSLRQTDKRETLCYRFVSFISNPCRLFSSVMKDDLMHYLKNKKSTFCCFADFSKPFDFVNRKLLILALQQGSKGNLYL